VKFQLNQLNIQFRRSLQRIDLSSHIIFIHGQISTGKSSIARLIDYCLGGSLHSTPALNQELVGVQLALRIEDNDVLLEREGTRASTVSVSWRREDGEGTSILAPIEATESPIWADSVFNLSDLLFFLSGTAPIKVRRRRGDPESPLVRLSFRDLMWYCYLDQDHLDSSFFRLEDEARKYKSRDVMRFVTGFYTERMNELELELERTTENRHVKEEAGTQIQKFLDELGYGSALEIDGQIRETQMQLRTARAALVTLRESHTTGTHFADDLRSQLTLLADQLASDRQVVADLKMRITEQEQLRAELVTSKFKLSRAQAATELLSGVRFKRCPECGTPTESLHRESSQCSLCGTKRTEEQPFSDRPEMLNRDLDARILDLDQSLKQHRRQLVRQERRLVETQAEKESLDARLSDELATYDSAFLANTRAAERQAATLEEQLKNLQKVARMPEALANLQREIASLQIQERSLRGQIDYERRNLQAADSRVTDLEELYRDILLRVGVPGIGPTDAIHINRTTWIPTIFQGGNEDLGYDFYSAGSGGKKTLLNVCYALAIHKLAVIHDLPLPSFLIVDSPMKNISKDANKQTFLALYNQLYALAMSDLRSTQFLVIDNEYAPPPADVQVSHRYMSNDDPTAPPLIPEYKGA
jgi:hypothetical protein